MVCVGIQLSRLRQTELEFWASLSYVIKLYPYKQKNFSYELRLSQKHETKSSALLKEYEVIKAGGIIWVEPDCDSVYY